MRKHLPRALAALALTGAGACAPAPQSLTPVLTTQALATQRLAIVHAQDAAMLRSATGALLDTRRTLLRGQVHRSLLQRGYLTPLLEPDAAALDADLADPGADSPLLRDIRARLLTRDQAASWLSDYALALRMTEGDAICNALLARLSSIRNFESDSDALLAALDARNAHASALFAEIDASAQALSQYASFAPAPGPATTDALRRTLAAFISATIDDPQRRAAVLELLDSLLTPAPVSAPLALVPTE